MPKAGLLWVKMFSVAIAMVFAVNDAVAGDEQTYFFEPFDAPSATWVARGAKLSDGRLHLTVPGSGKYDGTALQFKPKLNMPAKEGESLRLSWVVDTLGDVENRPQTSCSARFFLVPGEISSIWLDPYSAKDTLHVMLTSPAPGEDTILVLYRKSDGQPAGYGELLYQAKVAPKQFPLQIDLTLTAQTYRLAFNRELASDKGQVSGMHKLPAERWRDGMSFAIRVVNHAADMRAQLTLDKVSAASETAPAAVKSPTTASQKEPETTKPIEVVVRARPDLRRQVGGISEVQPIFGGNVNGSTPAEADDLVRALNLNSSRVHLWPDVYGVPAAYRAPVTPWYGAQHGWKSLSREEALAAWDRWYQLDFDSIIDDAARQGINASRGMYSQLKQFQKWGSSRNIVFFSNHRIDGSADRHPKGVNNYFHGYIEAVRKHSPWVDIAFVQLSNEPTYGWWTGQFGSTQEAVQTWIRVFNRADDYFHRNYSDIVLLGPCLASDTFFSWSGWKTWTVPVLKEATHPLKYFNYHNYESGSYTQLAWMEMLQAQADILGRPRPQAVVTEMNRGVNWAVSEGKFAWWAQHLFTALDHPDKYHLISYFLLNWGRKHALGNLISDVDGRMVPTDTYWLYWVLRQTRGAMCPVQATPNDSAIKVFACRPKDNQFVISLLNNSSRQAHVVVDPGLANGTAVGKVSRYYAHPAGGIIRHDEETLPSNVAQCTLNVPPGGVESIVWELAKPLAPIARTLVEEQFYAPMVAQQFSKDITTSITLPRLPRDDETVALRFAVSTDDGLGAQGITLRFNKHDIPVAWNDAPSEAADRPSNVRWMQVPLDRSWVEKENQLVLIPDTSYRLMFASLVLSQQPDARSAAAIQTEQLARFARRVQAALNTPSHLVAGTTVPITLMVMNRFPEAQTVQVDWQLPPGAHWIASPEKKIQLNSGQRSQLSGKLSIPSAQEATWTKIGATLRGSSDPMVVESPIRVLPNRVARAAGSPPRIDGNLSEWADVSPVTWSSGNLKTRIRLRWDSAALYAGVEVEGDFAPRAPTSVDRFWDGDCVEFFLDLENDKSYERNANDCQLFFCPLGVNGGKPLRGGLAFYRHTESLKRRPVSDESLQAAAVVSNHGYLLECAIPWNALSADFRPQAGMRIGFDVALDHNGQGSKVMRSIFGIEGKPYNQPNQWGTLFLEP